MIYARVRCEAIYLIFFLCLRTDPFGDGSGGLAELGGETKKDVNLGSGLVHIRIQQRNGRKTLTTVQGLESQFDKKKLVRAFKKEFACNGTVVEHPEYGEVIQLQGDQRNNVCQFLTKIGIVKETQLKVMRLHLPRIFSGFFNRFNLSLKVHGF